MRSLFSIKGKLRLAILLFVIMVVIVGTSVWEKSCVTDINESSLSIYKDRLLPATYVFYLSDNLYKKRIILHQYLTQLDLDKHQIKDQLAEYNSKIDSLIKDFETTYLVDAESESLNDFKQQLNTYNKIEQKFITSGSTLFKDDKESPLYSNLLESFEILHKDLIKLSSIQTTVGKELTAGSQHNISNVNLISNFQISIVIILGLVIQILILTSKVVKPKFHQKFRLN